MGICDILIYLFCCRFEHKHIYTYIGEVCVSVNPYQSMNIYDMKYVDKYKGEFEHPTILFVLREEFPRKIKLAVYNKEYIKTCI